jgi:pSer/pThr/pTyr-binding forkhead associated (FHA) protein
MWKLTIQDDQGNKTVVHLVRDDYTVGRDESNAVRLTERNISRHHARLVRTGEQWRIHDLDSYNGCYVNGARVGEPQPLLHGDLVQLGDYRLSLEDESLASMRDDGVLTLPGRPGINTQSDRLVLMAGPGQGQEFVLGAARVVLGRGEECEISINHPSVSRVHAEIRRVGNDGHYEMVDLGSANGVRVNGVELPSSMLDARDVIELGDVLLKFLPAGEIYLPGVDESRRSELSAHPPSSSISLPVKFALAAAIAAVGVVVVLAVRSSGPAPEPLAENRAGDHLAETLREAKGLLDNGDAEGAAAKVSAIPGGSNLRESAEFKAIQDGWADSLFRQAAATEDTSEKRAILDRIARSPMVEGGRRKRAAAELEQLQKSAVDVADLPNAAAKVSTPSAEPTSSTPPKLAAPSAAVQPTLPGEKVAPTTPKPSPAPASSIPLVRKNPFGNP